MHGSFAVRDWFLLARLIVRICESLPNGDVTEFLRMVTWRGAVLSRAPQDSCLALTPTLRLANTD